jgi:hypothetical protein
MCVTRRAGYVRHKLPIFFLNTNLNLSIDQFFCGLYFSFRICSWIPFVHPPPLIAVLERKLRMLELYDFLHAMWSLTVYYICISLTRHDSSFQKFPVSLSCCIIFSFYICEADCNSRSDSWHVTSGTSWKILKLSLSSHEIKTSPPRFK